MGDTVLGGLEMDVCLSWTEMLEVRVLCCAASFHADRKKSQSKYCETLHNATKDSLKRWSFK